MFNNRKATRFSNRKYRKNIVCEELYNEWKVKTNFDISFKQFKDYWKYIAREYVQAIVDNPDGAKLDASIGDIYIGYIPWYSKKVIDYKTSSELDSTIYHENWNSNGKLGKIIYGTQKRKYIHKLHLWWGFRVCRNFKIKAVNSLREYPERYKNSIEKRSLTKYNQ